MGAVEYPANEHLAASPVPLNGPAATEATYRFAFLLVPGFSYIALASALEPLRMANMIAGHSVFAATTCSIDGTAVVASNGVSTQPDHAIAMTDRPDAVFVCGPNPVVFPDSRRLIRWLHGLAGHGTALGGLDTGSYLLAQAGLLNGYRCTVHWQDMASIANDFPDILVSERVFEIDRDRYTCSGGTAAMDMMLELVGVTLGETETSATAADLLVHERPRDRHDRQRIPLRHRLGTGNAPLASAVMLMEANVEEPVRIGEIAAYVELSERQLERLFETHLASTPTTFYMGLRLARARRLLLGTEASISDIAERCGFASAAHFSRRYREWFECSPRADRSGASDG